MINQENIANLNIYASSNRATIAIKYIEKDKTTIILRDFNMPLSIEQAGKTKEHKHNAIIELKNTINQPDLKDIYRTFYPTSEENCILHKRTGTIYKNRLGSEI